MFDNQRILLLNNDIVGIFQVFNWVTQQDSVQLFGHQLANQKWIEHVLEVFGVFSEELDYISLWEKISELFVLVEKFKYRRWRSVNTWSGRILHYNLTIKVKSREICLFHNPNDSLADSIELFLMQQLQKLLSGWNRAYQQNQSFVLLLQKLFA